MGSRGKRSSAPGGYGTVTAKGYRRVWHHGKQRLEHDVVWEDNYGPVPEGWVVHHRDENKLNNAIENLVILTALVHKRIHSGCAYVDGTWVKPCRRCQIVKEIGGFYPRRDGVSSWCRSCTCAAVTRRKNSKSE